MLDHQYEKGEDKQYIADIDGLVKSHGTNGNGRIGDTIIEYTYDVAPKKQSNNIWETDAAFEYGEFSANIPTDQVAYEVGFEALQLTSESKVLVIGCHIGNDVVHLASKGPKYVLGTDINSDTINLANESYLGANTNFGFLHVPHEKPIKIPRGINGFDAISMTFVHPTISSAQVLEETIKKASDVALQGARFMMLGLHPNSLEKNAKYKYYGHHLEDGAEYRDGQPFFNELRLPNGNNFQFYDYCWTNETLVSMLQKNGFSRIEVIDVDYNLQGKLGEVMDREISRINSEYGLQQNTNEWQVPLYQIIVGYKDNEIAQPDIIEL